MILKKQMESLEDFMREFPPQTEHLMLLSESMKIEEVQEN